MDDFLKFLPIVLYLVYRAYTSGKKKEQKAKKRPMQPENPPKHSASLEEILKELAGENKPSQPELVVEKKVVPKKDRKRTKISFKDHQYDFMPEYEHHADTGKELSEIKQEIRDEKNLAEPKVSEVDLEQAIIYDAILNRPYD